MHSMSNHNFDKLSAKRARFSRAHFGTFDVVQKHHLHFLTLGILARIAPQRMLHDPNESTGAIISTTIMADAGGFTFFFASIPQVWSDGFVSFDFRSHQISQQFTHGKVSHEAFQAFALQYLFRHSIMITPTSIGPVFPRCAHIVKSTGLVKFGCATDERRDANFRFYKTATKRVATCNDVAGEIRVKR